MQEMRVKQDTNRSALESKIDRMKNELTEDIEKKIQSLRNDITQELSQESERLDSVFRTVQSLQGRLESLESNQSNTTAHMDTGNSNGAHTFRPNYGDDSDISVIVSGLPPLLDGETLLQKANDIITALGLEVDQNVQVMSTVRFRMRDPVRPGLVKITLRNRDEKINVLRNKMKLKTSQTFSEVYIKSYKSHAERLIELNARAILRQLPQGRNFRVDANGRIQAKPQHGNNANNQ